MTTEAAAAEAARIIEIAHAIRYRPSALPAMGFRGVSDALGQLKRRYRGKVGAFIGKTLGELLPMHQDRVRLVAGGKNGKQLWLTLADTNITQIAVSLVLDAGVRPPDASRLTGVDPGNLHRAVKAEKQRRKRASVIKQTWVEPCSPTNLM